MENHRFITPYYGRASTYCPIPGKRTRVRGRPDRESTSDLRDSFHEFTIPSPMLSPSRPPIIPHPIDPTGGTIGPQAKAPSIPPPTPPSAPPTTRGRSVSEALAIS